MAREHNNTFLTWSSSVGRAIDCRGFHISIGHRFDSGLRDNIYIHLEYIYAGVPEWSKGTDSSSVAYASRVRISPRVFLLSIIQILFNKNSNVVILLTSG